jgi:flagellin-specific chaperone FliS
MAKRLREVHREQDPAVVDECKTLIRTLQEGFSEAYKKERSTSFPVTNKTAGSGIKISL